MAGPKQEELDANEPATPFKLEKARERGSIVRSGEVTFAVVLMVCVACIYGLGRHAITDVAELIRRGVPFAARGDLSPAAALAYIRELSSHAVLAVAPALFAIWVTAVLVAALQARGVFSAEPLKPDFSRLNPATGLKRLFSIKSLHDLWRSSAKIVVITVAAQVWGEHHARSLHALARQNPGAQVESGLELAGSALTLLTGLLLAFAALDWALNRQDFMRRMRMSRREIKDEHKEREGDPRIRKRLRELRAAWAKRARQLAKVRNADVLLTNPTHYAVALEYRHGEMPSPMITARGAGDLARRMRDEARRRHVPIVEHPPLTRALFALDEREPFVPEEHFDQVARVLRWVFAARRLIGAGVSLAR
jgi:flagellar biosynthetic protein FlhB